MKLFIKNIKQLLLATEQAPEIAKGKAMNQIPIIEDAWLAVEDGKIADFGKMEDWQNIFATSQIISFCFDLSGSRSINTSPLP